MTGVQTVGRRRIFRSLVAEKQHTKMFSVAQFWMVMKRFVLSIILLKMIFQYLENAMEIALKWKN